MSQLDHFILARLEHDGLEPSGEVDRTGLLRRLCFDLIGLPPTPDQAAEFINDTSPRATERLVDQLLESPHFGERSGRHWLDLVRYAESRGHEFYYASNAFEYRDYVIRAFNADVSYDQLVREHIAGDLIAQPRLNPELGFNESVLGTGFWFLGEWVHSPVDIRKDESDRFDNMIDVMSKTFLGVTVSCARCHDHKFDAISTADYYSLTGFLQSSDYREVRFESMERNRRVAEKLAKVDSLYRRKVAELLKDRGVVLPTQTALPAAITDQLIFNYQTSSPEQYMQDGYIFGTEPRRRGDAYLDQSGHQPVVRCALHGCAVNDPLWDGLETSLENAKRASKLEKIPRSGRTLRTPTFELTEERVACRVRGEGHVVACIDSHRLLAGPLHQNTIQSVKAGSSWVEFDLSRYVGHRLHLEFTPAEKSQLEVFWGIQGGREQINLAKAHQDALTRSSTRRSSFFYDEP